MPTKRPIKFRAWDRLNGKMVPDTEIQMQSLPDFKAVPLNQSLEMLGSLYTLMQFTGLLDKNGKDIYEGDIVRNWECQMAHHSIEWMIDGFKLNYHNDTHGVIHPKLLEAVGNIYENPELLQERELA